ncbi:MAG: class I SAM-dependent methyltransferase [Myxococcota bacterium]
MRKDLHEENRLSWNAATRAHNSHKQDQAGFFRRGGSTLFPEERELLGTLTGSAVLHLQCNAGQDTLSLARLCDDVTGVDISDEAIGFAEQLARESGVAARFIRSDVYEFLEQNTRAYDVVFSSYGAVCWLSDLDAWARGVARALRPGGRLVLMEFHPVAMMLDRQGRMSFPYFNHGEPVRENDGVHDYVADAGANLAPMGWQDGVKDFRNPHACHGFYWTSAELLSAMIGGGLVVETVREYPYSNGCRLYEGMVQEEGNRWRMPKGAPEIPLMLGCVARRR